MPAVMEQANREATASRPPVAAPTTHSTAAASQAQPKEYLSYRLGAEEYGVDILRVQEIRRYEAPTRIASAPPFVTGVINLRGVIVPIVDLRLKLGCKSAEHNEFTVVIVMNVGGRTVGAVVDAVSDVVDLGAEQIKPSPKLRSGVDRDLITGIGCLKNGDSERMLILTDIEALMGDTDLGLIEAH